MHRESVLTDDTLLRGRQPELLPILRCSQPDRRRRRWALAGTEWAQLQVDTLRLRLLKIAAQVRLTARCIWLRYSAAYPWKTLFAHACGVLRC